MRWAFLVICMLVLFKQAKACDSTSLVAVGGISGFTDLANPANTYALEACHVRLYLHRVAWERTLPGTREAILGVFKNAGSPVVEIEMHSNPTIYFRGYFTQQFLASGVVSREAHVNYFSVEHPFAEWTNFVDAGRAVGLSIVAPIFSPNNGQFQRGSFVSPIWDKVRMAAIYGGGLTLDPPSDFFLAQSYDYRRFTLDEIRWANVHHLRSTVIVSPGKSRGNFLYDTERFVSILKAAGAQPTQYVVENYEPRPDSTYQNSVGSEQGGNSVAAVALWIEQHQ